MKREVPFYGGSLFAIFNFAYYCRYCDCSLTDFLIHPLISFTVVYCLLWTVRNRYMIVFLYRLLKTGHALKFKFSHMIGRVRSYLPMVKSSDIILAIPEKSGNTWVQHIAHQLRMGGEEPTFKDQDEIMPWLEMSELWSNANPFFRPQPAAPRLFKCHLTFSQLRETGMMPPLVAPMSTLSEAKGPKGPRFIFVFRSLEDSLYSFWQFSPSMAHIKPELIPCDTFINWRLKSEPLILRLESLVDWWKMRNHPNVLFLFYEDILENHTATIKRVAEFMKLKSKFDITHELIEKVREQTSHKTMSSPAHFHRFLERPVREWLNASMNLPSHMHLSEKELTGKVRSNGGQVGNGQKLPPFLREKINLAWKSVVETKLGFKSLDEMRTAWQRENSKL